MKTYIGTETSKTIDLTAEEFGAYERLRRYYWEHEGLPNDDRRLMRITGVDPDRWEEARSAICWLFADGWRIPELDQERAVAGERRAKAVERSQKAHAARYGKSRPATSNATSSAASSVQPMPEAVPEAVLNDCPSASASDEVRYEERLAPTHARETGGDRPLKAPPTDSMGRALLREKGIPPRQVESLLPLLMGGRLHQSQLDQVMV